MAHLPLWPLRRAARRLQEGGIVAYPTEGVYGLGCDPFDAHAVERLFVLKRRPLHKGLILLAADFSQIEAFLEVTPAMRDRLLATWPGPVTWIVPVTKEMPDWLVRDGTVAVRVSAHPLAAALCRAFGGPIVSTSANPSGRPPARNALQTRRYFPRREAFVLTGATGGLNRPTPIYDARSGQRLR
jgi:L-threonylcarbamoyladenylate synthase